MQFNKNDSSKTDQNTLDGFRNTVLRPLYDLLFIIFWYT